MVANNSCAEVTTPPVAVIATVTGSAEVTALAPNFASCTSRGAAVWVRRRRPSGCRASAPGTQLHGPGVRGGENVRPGSIVRQRVVHLLRDVDRRTELTGTCPFPIRDRGFPRR